MKPHARVTIPKCNDVQKKREGTLALPKFF
jgi:hypothetical protein